MKKLIIITMVLTAGIAAISNADLTSFRWQNTAAGSVKNNLGDNVDAGVALYYLSNDSNIDFDPNVLLTSTYGDDFLYNSQITGTGAFAGRLPGVYVTESDLGNNYQGYQSYLIVLNMAFASFTTVEAVPLGTYYWISSLSLDLADPNAPNTPQTFNPGSIQTLTTVIPEPATMGLFGLGAIGTWLIRRKKKLAA
jgi:Na+/alanine symporter